MSAFNATSREFDNALSTNSALQIEHFFGQTQASPAPVPPPVSTPSAVFAQYQGSGTNTAEAVEYSSHGRGKRIAKDDVLAPALSLLLLDACTSYTYLLHSYSEY